MSPTFVISFVNICQNKHFGNIDPKVKINILAIFIQTLVVVSFISKHSLPLGDVSGINSIYCATKIYLCPLHPFTFSCFWDLWYIARWGGLSLRAKSLPIYFRPIICTTSYLRHSSGFFGEQRTTPKFFLPATSPSSSCRNVYALK